MLPRATLLVLISLTLIPSCSTSGDGKTESDVCRALVEDLTSPDFPTFQHACESLFAKRLAAVPTLLEHATDTETATCLPPIIVTHSCFPETSGWTRGHVAIYLLESIRVGQLAHSAMPGFFTGDVPRDVRAAQAEYKKWWDSVQDKSFPTYEPRVQWTHVSEADRARLKASGGSDSPVYITLPLKPESQSASVRR